VEQWESKTNQKNEDNSIVEELKRRWEQKLVNKVGKDAIRTKDDRLLRHSDSKPTLSAPNSVYLTSKISPTTLFTSTFGKPRASIKLCYPENIRQLELPTRRVANRGRASCDSNAPKPHPMTSKRRKLVYNPNGRTNHDPSALSTAEIQHQQDPVLQGMKLYIHIPSFSSKIETVLPITSKDVVLTRVIRILRENIQTATKITSRTVLMLRDMKTGQVRTVLWPSYAVNKDKSELIRTLNERANRRSNSLVAETSADMLVQDGRNSIGLESYDGGISEKQKQEVSSNIHNIISDWIDSEDTVELSANNLDAVKEFSNNLLEEVGDLSWCDLPVFGEDEPADEPAERSSQVPSQPIFSQVPIFNDASTLSKQRAVEQRKTRAMLVSGEIVDQDVLDDIENYFSRRSVQKPKFELEPLFVAKFSLANSEGNLANVISSPHSENIAELNLHPDDDPSSVVPSLDMELIGKASKVVCGERELYVVMKDVYVKFISPGNGSNESRDMILPQLSIRLNSLHLFGKS
jgi:hypothetical protein